MHIYICIYICVRWGKTLYYTKVGNFSGNCVGLRLLLAYLVSKLAKHMCVF